MPRACCRAALARATSQRRRRARCAAPQSPKPPQRCPAGAPPAGPRAGGPRPRWQVRRGGRAPPPPSRPGCAAQDTNLSARGAEASFRLRQLPRLRIIPSYLPTVVEARRESRPSLLGSHFFFFPFPLPLPFFPLPPFFSKLSSLNMSVVMSCPVVCRCEDHTGRSPYPQVACEH